MNKAPAGSIDVALVIFAHDESSVIKKSVSSAGKALGKRDALFVVADNCSDDTPRLARNAGARVFIRDNGYPDGKGAAMAWFVRYHWDVLRQFTLLVVLDADSLIRPDFIRRIKAQWNGRDQALQCFVSPVGFERSSISTLIAFSDLVEQTVFDGLRSCLRWPVRLRGTGMVISPKLLLSVSDRVQTNVEDIALNLLLAENGIRVKNIHSAVVYDPKPTEAAEATRQRARWFRGQWAALWQYRSTVAKIAAQGPAGWSLLGSLFMKPRWLMLAIKVGLVLAFFRLPLVSWTLGSLIVCDLLLILSGLFRMRERKIFLKAILHLPGFVFMWLGGILLSFRRRSWLRVRETGTFPHRLPQGFGQARVLKPVKVNSSQMDLLYPPGGSS